MEADYGSLDWKIPRRNYVWYKSHKNVEQGREFTPKEWKTAYKIYN